MFNIVSEHTRAVLARSLPAVTRHKDQIVSIMEAHLQGVDPEGEPFGQSEVAAMILTEMLVLHAGRIAESGQTWNLDKIAKEHWSLAIDGRHYSRFGDMLVSILKDALGAGLPAEVASAWSDTFWAIIRASQPRAELVDA